MAARAPREDAYDEAIPVDDTDEEEMSTPASSEAGSPSGKSASGSTANQSHASPQKSPMQAQARGRRDDGSDESSSEASSTSDEDDNNSGSVKKKGGAVPGGGYNPDDFKDVQVSTEVEELFQYITRYKPHTIELDTAFKPFIPELIPSIGEVDAFLKMPRPDEKPSTLGMVRLDEPTLNPSDPSILDLQLRSLSKNQDLQPMEVRSLENAEKCPKEIDNWVRRIDELNRSKPAPAVQYSRRMPDIEQLMQVWPAEFEEFLQQNPLPDLADLELDLPSYVRVFASILDVPVHSQITETLHVIFTLYSEFKANQHFSKTDTVGNFGQLDPYSFPMQNFAADATSEGSVRVLAEKLAMLKKSESADE